MTDIQVGQDVLWIATVSNYGHTKRIPAKVVRVGKRITIDTGARKTVVRRENLEIPTLKIATGHQG